MTMMTTTKTKTTEKLVDAAYALGKDAKEIVGLIASLNRVLLTLRAIYVSVNR